jgi:hypothetical protein
MPLSNAPPSLVVRPPRGSIGLRRGRGYYGPGPVVAAVAGYGSRRSSSARNLASRRRNFLAAASTIWRFAQREALCPRMPDFA